MSSLIKVVTSNIYLTFSKLNYVPVRYRYHAEKIKRGPLLRKFGYDDKVFQKGLLPRIKDATVLPGPVYRPANAWSPEKVKHGQNDYIDILGGGKIKPHEVIYDVPKWLRGVKGNEMQLLALKRNVFAGTRYEIENPTAWYNIRRRFLYLYKYLNRKTKTSLMKD